MTQQFSMIRTLLTHCLMMRFSRRCFSHLRFSLYSSILKWLEYLALVKSLMRNRCCDNTFSISHAYNKNENTLLQECSSSIKVSPSILQKKLNLNIREKYIRTNYRNNNDSKPHQKISDSCKWRFWNKADNKNHFR